MARKRTSKLTYFVQAVIVYALYGVARLLPISVASAFGGWIGRLIGIFHKGSKVAHRNLMLAMPERAAEHARIVRGMWENLVRVMAEYPHLEKMWEKGFIKVVGEQFFPDKEHNIVFVSSHLANWEMCPLVAGKLGYNFAGIYRPINNRYLESLLQKMRGHSEHKLHPKSAEGARALIRQVRDGGSVGIIADQRLSDGVNVPFFGMPALTTPFPAFLSLRYNVQLVLVRIERMRGAHMLMTLEELNISHLEGDDLEKKTEEITIAINALFEKWIAERPEQWLWMHDRWRPLKKKKS